MPVRCRKCQRTRWSLVGLRQDRVRNPHLSPAGRRVDVGTLERQAGAEELGLNDIGRVALRVSTRLSVDSYARNRPTGSFVPIDEASNATVGAGMIAR